MERVLTRELKPSSKHTRNFIERNAFMKVFLKVVGVLGVSLVMSGMIQDSTKASGTESHPKDGVLTPAQSVLGAIQG